MQANRDAEPTTVADIATPDAVCVDAAESVAGALARMRECGTSCLVVVDGRRPVGLFTERDALSSVADGAGDREEPISRRMTRSPLTCSSETALLEAYGRMDAGGARHLVLTDAAGDVVGIATESDFAAALWPQEHWSARTAGEVVRREPIALTALLEQEQGFGVMAADATGVVRYASRAARHMLPSLALEGRSLGEVMGLLGADVADMTRRFALLGIGEYDCVDALRSGDGRTLRASIGAAGTPPGESVGFLVLLLDSGARRGGEEHLRRLFRAAPVPMVLTRLADQVILEVNPAAERLSGWRVGDTIGRRSDALSAWVDDSERAGYLASLKAGRAVGGQFVRMRRRDGQEVSVQLFGEQVTLNGVPCVISMFAELTPQADYLRQIQQHHQLLGAVFKAIGDVLIVTDAKHRILLANDATESVLGLPAERLLGRLADEFLADHRLAELPARCRLVSSPDASPVRVRRCSGELFPADISVSDVRDEDGQVIGRALQLHDVSAREGRRRELAEQRDRLRESERRHRAMFESAGHPMLALDRKGRITASNRAACQFLRCEDMKALVGKSPVELSPPTQPDGSPSEEKAQELFRRALAGERLRFEWQHVSAQGDPLPVDVALTRVEWDGECSLLVTWYDLSDRKRAQALEQRAAAVFENTAEGIMLTDAENRILAVNPAFTAITGYGSDEVLGQTPKLLQSGRQGREFYQRMWRQIAATGTWKGEIWNRRKDGEVYPQWLSISEIRDADGALVQRIAVFTDITGVRRSEEALEHLTHYDPITELPNATLLRIQLDQALQSAEPQQRPLAVLLLNLDGFNRVVATFGHETGDRLLAAVAERLRELPLEQPILARPVGDTFAVVLSLPNWDRSPSRQAVLIQDGLADGIDVIGLPAMTPSCCIGIALYPADAATGTDLLRNADAALQRAKSEGAGSIAFYRPALTAAARQRIEIEATLRTAFMAEQFVLYFQPKLDLARRCVIGAEALIRWARPDGVVVGPGEFMPVIEGTDLALALDRWVLRSAARKLRAWEDAGLPRMRISVNISAAMLTGGNLPAEIESAVAETGVDPTTLEIEVLENILIEEPERAEAELAAVSAFGSGIALDDFGTGYASLGYLKRFAFDFLKIDRSFIAGLARESDDMAIVRATILMAHHLGIQVVAEGVERDDQIRQLSVCGCDVLQGYRIGRPMPEDAFMALLREGTDALGETLSLALARYILLLSQDPVHFGAAERRLGQLGWDVQRVGTIDEARIRLAVGPVDVLICDGVLPDGGAIDFLTEAAERHPAVTRMLFAPPLPSETLVEAINRAGLFRCLTKPCDIDELADAVQAAYEYGLERQRL